ncbi:hypothetical protein BJX70DRAFT_95138 [Aspergillus crustosus]
MPFVFNRLWDREAGKLSLLDRLGLLKIWLSYSVGIYATIISMQAPIPQRQRPNEGQAAGLPRHLSCQLSMGCVVSSDTVCGAELEICPLKIDTKPPGAWFLKLAISLEIQYDHQQPRHDDSMIMSVKLVHLSGLHIWPRRYFGDSTFTSLVLGWVQPKYVPEHLILTGRYLNNRHRYSFAVNAGRYLYLQHTSPLP